MGQRQSNTLKPRSAFKYSSVEECEVAEDFHVVEPKTWPPPRIGTTTGDPSLSAVCVLCGGNVIVYEAHATGGMQGVRVILPEKKKTA